MSAMPAPLKAPVLADQLSMPEVLRRVCEAGAEALCVERVGVWLLLNNDKILRCVNLYERSKRMHTKGATLLVADFPSYFQAVASLPALPSAYAKDDPRTTELREAYLEPLNIFSMLDAALFRNGKLIGVVCHEQVGEPRNWSEPEHDYARALADLITERMQLAESKLTHDHALGYGSVEASRAEVIGRLAAGVAHDFKNLLMVILGNADAIKGHSDSPKDVELSARHIIDAAERGNALVRQLLDFGRESAGAPRVLSVPEAVGGCVHLLRAAAGPRHPIEFTRDKTPGRVLIDRGQLERILLNLVLNARDAMRSGGTIRIHVCAREDSQDGGDLAPYVRVSVSDTGEGIADGDRSHIFEPFFTTKHEHQGTGLGLAVVQRAVDRTGGFVRVVSEPGSGSTFQIYFPCVTTEAH